MNSSTLKRRDDKAMCCVLIRAYCILERPGKRRQWHDHRNLTNTSYL